MISAMARQRSGMPTTSGKSLALSGQDIALTRTQAAKSATAELRISEARLCTGGPFRAPGLDRGVGDDGDGADQEDDDDRAGEPGGCVAIDRDVEVVLGDLAEHQPEDQRRTRP